ncbi:MAG: type II secretion system protein [Acidobacteria bacterium]|nr:type II secretion system protein [Acidobacteriota bacterium]
MLNKKYTKGFSLIELVVTASIFLIIVVLSGQLIRLAGFDSQVNTNLNEVQQNARVALKFLERDITNNGDTYLVGLAGGQGLVGPITSIEAFQNIRGTNGKNPNTNGVNAGSPVPTMGNRKQPLFSLLPVRRSDSLGNGANTLSASPMPTPIPGQTAAENGSADRLTVAYEDEFFVAGVQSTYGTNQPNAATATANMNARNAATAPTMGSPSVSNDEEFQGFWSRPTPSAPAKLTLTPRRVDNTDLAGLTTYAKVFYDVSGVRAGDIFKISNGNTEVLAIVSKVNQPGTDQLTNPPSLEFALDALKMNQTTAAIPSAATIQAMPQVARDTLLASLYPLDFLPASPDAGDPAPNTVRVTATRVLIYTYIVDTTTRDLIRRRYTYAPSTDPLGNAFINDPVCQNVERFWLSFNLIIPANPPTTTIPTLGNERELDPDATQADYTSLQSIRRVNVNLILRSTELDRRTRQPSRVGIQASFSPRNIVYQINENAS